MSTNEFTPESTQRLIEYALQLMSKQSETPNDMGCCSWIMERLETLGFSCKILQQGDTTNLYAQYGNSQRVIAFVGHTDVVPAGDTTSWQTPPYEPVVDNGVLRGRGAVDMKGALACMLVACENYLQQWPQAMQNADYSFAWLLTSDEEGSGDDGMPKLLEYLSTQGIQVAYALVGEPTSEHTIGDTLKVARRGSLSANISVYGKQGHAAYPLQATNAIHCAMPALASLCKLHWPTTETLFPATALQLINLKSGLGVSNVIPGQLTAELNIRYAPPLSAAEIMQQVEQSLEQDISCEYQLKWRHNAAPYHCNDSIYINKCSEVISACTDQPVTISASGGTSDGRHLAAHGAQVVELGLKNQYAHQIDEQTTTNDLKQLCQLYVSYLKHFFP